MFVSPYVFAILIGVTVLVTSVALGWLGFGKEPDRNYNDPIGPAGANLAHALLAYLRPVSVGILITGCVGLLGELAGQPPLRTMVSAVAAGTVAAVATYWLPQTFNELSRRGGRLPPMIGQFGIAVDTVPAHGRGFGAA